MTSSRKNRTLFIDKEAASALELVLDGLLLPVTKLMGEQESKEVLTTGLLDGKSFPFPFILAPSGKKNEEVISSCQKDEEITILCEGQEYATLVVSETFKIDPKERVKHIYGTDDLTHPGVMVTMKRLGSWAISGEYRLIDDTKNINLSNIKNAQNQLNANHTTAIVMAANPLHRGHERLIRQALDGTDLLVIFLLKPYDESNLSYELRQESLDYFINDRFI